MTEVSIDQLQKAVEGLHNCKAGVPVKAHIREDYQHDLVWEGNVFVFPLIDHPTAPYCYAWSSLVEGSDKRRFYAVLHEGPVKSPADAVRATIVKDYRGGQDD